MGLGIFDFATIISDLFLDNPITASLIVVLIIFLETGVVLLPFLPGDSLLFLTGTFLGNYPILNVLTLGFFLFLAAVLGDSLNYLIGKNFGKKILAKNLIKKEYLVKTKNYFAKYGHKTIFLSRFIPIVRTIAPFFAGIGKMNYAIFIKYNLLGGFVWIFIFLLSGYFFGGLPIVKENLDLILISIILVSVLPLLKELLFSKANRV